MKEKKENGDDAIIQRGLRASLKCYMYAASIKILLHKWDIFYLHKEMIHSHWHTVFPAVHNGLTKQTIQWWKTCTTLQISNENRQY